MGGLGGLLGPWGRLQRRRGSLGHLMRSGRVCVPLGLPFPQRRNHHPQPVLPHKEPREHGAIQQVKGEGGALEAEDAGRDPDDEPAGLHRGEGGGYQRVPRPQDVPWLLDC